jgi:tRNA-dihydrouridine synthase
MLAPMQGLTNAALRASFVDRVRPDVLFTEFVRVHSQARKRIARSDLRDIATHTSSVPLVVQLIGAHADSLAAAATRLQSIGCRHLNLNLGCPYGRMTTAPTGGELLRYPERLFPLLSALRRSISGSFSVKCRAGYADPRQIFELLPLFADCGVDYLILHPRTVAQQYSGSADHDLTREVGRCTSLPVIVNGDITDAAQGRELLADEALAGLMLGRGALADPLLFKRIREGLPEADAACRRLELSQFLLDLLPRYQEKFCGERQTLMKLKDVLNFIPDAELQRDLSKLKRMKSLKGFQQLIVERFALP